MTDWMKTAYSPIWKKHGDYAGHWVGHRRQGGGEVVGQVAIGHAGEGLYGGQQAVGGHVHPNNQEVDEAQLVNREVGLGHHRLVLVRLLGLVLEGGPPVGLQAGVVQPGEGGCTELRDQGIDGQIKGNPRKSFQSNERGQTHAHHGRQEGEEYLRGEVGREVLGLQRPRVPSPCQVLSGVASGVDTRRHANALRQRDQRGNEAAQALPDEVGGDVLGGKPRHEWQEGDGRCAVHQGEEEGDDEEGGAVWRPAHHGGDAPEEGEQDAGQQPDGEDGVDDSGLSEVARPQLVHERDQ